MTEDHAYTFLSKVTGMYNKNLNNEQFAIWLDELEPLNEVVAQKVVKKIKTEKLYENTMPSIPQFLSMYKSFMPKESTNKGFCYVCMNRGYDILREVTESDGRRTLYDYTLHCDCCDKGLEQKIDSNGYKSHPISKYYDVNRLIAINKEKHNKISAKNIQKELEFKKNVKTITRLLSI